MRLCAVLASTPILLSGLTHRDVRKSWETASCTSYSHALPRNSACAHCHQPPYSSLLCMFAAYDREWLHSLSQMHGMSPNTSVTNTGYRREVVPSRLPDTTGQCTNTMWYDSFFSSTACHPGPPGVAFPCPCYSTGTRSYHSVVQLPLGTRRVRHPWVWKISPAAG